MLHSIHCTILKNIYMDKDKNKRTVICRSISCVSVPQTNHKYPYVIDFKMACLIVRKYYRIYNEKPPNMMFAEILLCHILLLVCNKRVHWVFQKKFDILIFVTEFLINCVVSRAICHNIKRNIIPIRYPC